LSGCELCRPEEVLFESDFAYVRYDGNSLSRGHVIVVPRRHVADFFDMSGAEQGSVLALLNRAKKLIDRSTSPTATTSASTSDAPRARRACTCMCT
jgi:diadenosine tetraphosphate (Ap4A) HIT family hydrolase